MLMKNIFLFVTQAYPKSVQDGIKLANEYVLRKTMVCDEENPFFTEWINYRVIENNKEVSGKAYLNNLYKFDEISEDMRLPISLNGKPLTNNVMEYLLDKGFSIVYQYPLEGGRTKSRDIWEGLYQARDLAMFIFCRTVHQTPHI